MELHTSIDKPASSRLIVLSEERKEVMDLTNKIKKYDDQENMEEEVFPETLRLKLPEGLQSRVRIRNCSICTVKKSNVKISTKVNEEAQCLYPFCRLSFCHALETCPYYLSVCIICKVPRGHEHEIKKAYMNVAAETLRNRIKEEINDEVTLIAQAFQHDTAYANPSM